MRAGEYDAAKEARDQCEKILDHLDAVDLAVHASFYRVSGDYYKVRGGETSQFEPILLSYLERLNLASVGNPILASHRRKPSSPTITATRSGTSRASTSRRT